MRHQQHGAAGVLHGAVEFAGFVFENAQAGDFVGNIAGIGFGVGMAHAQQHHQAGFDLAAALAALAGHRINVGAAHFLDNGTHWVSQ